MPEEIEKQYNPADYEDKIYQAWEDSGFFNPDNLPLPATAPAYTIVLPPPNITDKLHIGHGCMVATEDLLIRFHRMSGYRALWVPGTDHAAIATQNVVEKRLLKQGITRQSLGREKFLEEVWKFLRETQAVILNQIRKMGGSLDWSREAFTLDEPRQKAVQKMFIDMYDEGVIYRGERVVNWCPRCKSTLADDEVEYKDQAAKLYTFKYSKDFPISISTTRPETKLGDTAVAVNPKDERYKKYVGQTFQVDFVGVPLAIKIITDDSVDMNFGTGALGVTPAHSMVDYQMHLKNNISIVSVINEEAKISSASRFGEYSGLTTLEAREKIVEKLREAGLMEKEDDVQNNLSVCYRCDTGIEPLPSKQWFISVDKKIKRLENKSLKEKAIEAAETKEIKFVPERFHKVYKNWMENLHDWCISRQIWFGHRIPVWYRLGKDAYEVYKSDPEKTRYLLGVDYFIPDHEISEDEAAREYLIQDPDTLDTWFSSGIWTFSTLGWPDNYQDGKKIGDLARFHPTQVLETGFEILTLWVSRMIIMSYFALGEIPFSYVYLHGMVLDEKGKKMSKSKGNGIDPLDIISKYGADAARLALLVGNTPGNNLKLGEEKISAQRNFINKLWNISRYILEKAEGTFYKEIDFKNLTLADNWILAKLDKLIAEVTIDIKEFNFSQAGEKLVAFTKDDLADWYLEVSKFEDSPNKVAILLNILRNILKLWHPFIPFVTETIWQKFNSKLLLVEAWPVFVHSNRHGATGEVKNFEIVKEVITAIRNVRSENGIEPARKLKAIIYAGEELELLKANEVLIKSLRTGIEELEIKESGEKIPQAIYAAIGKIEIYLPNAVDTVKEKIRLEKEIANLEKFVSILENKLSNKEFTGKAPAKVVAIEQEKLANAKIELEKLNSQLKSLHL